MQAVVVPIEYRVLILLAGSQQPPKQAIGGPKPSTIRGGWGGVRAGGF